MRKHIAHAPLTPEEMIEGTTSKPLEVKLRCRPCGCETSLRTPWAAVATKAETDGWDGVVLGRIFTCPSCGAVDDYELTTWARLQLIAEMGLGISGKSRGCRVLPSVPVLFDGTTFRRPTQGLIHLRELTVKRPDNPEAWRRLGNFCERYGMLDEAVLSWRKAFALSADEFEAAYSLALFYWKQDTDEAAAVRGEHLLAAIERFPRDRTVGERKRVGFAESLTGMLFELIDHTDQPVVLMASWHGGEVSDGVVVNLSSVDLRTIERREGLVEFMARPDVVALGVTGKLPTDGPTRLQRLIECGASSLPTAGDRATLSAQSTGAPQRLGRNDLCYCGSGKKYKKCHLLLERRRSS